MHRNPLVETMPIADITNLLNISQNNNFVSVNNALAVDLTGQIGSESLGFNMFSGTGGLLDFVRGARYSSGGMSFIALSSTAQTKQGRLSKIDLTLSPGTVVSVPRTDVQYVVTEYGVAELRNKSIEQRVRAMIAVAHPDYREELAWKAKQVGLFSGYIPPREISA
jgi:4-hydroxybutyrate CoA-transferase